MSARFILAIETSTARGSVALASAETLIEAREIDPSRRNAAGLLPAIESTLATHGVKIRELAALAFSAGPGSFTGVRVAATVARALNAVAHVPIIKVPTLQVIAARADDDPRAPTLVAAMLNAKRGQVFVATYEKRSGEWIELSAPEIREPTEFVNSLKAGRASNWNSEVWLATGDALSEHSELLSAAGFEFADESLWQPDAEAVLRAAWPRMQRGEFCPPAEILPIYLRPPECEEVYESRRAAAKARRGEGVAPAGGAA